jgi:hypothetical protein
MILTIKGAVNTTGQLRMGKNSLRHQYKGKKAKFEDRAVRHHSEEVLLLRDKPPPGFAFSRIHREF